MTDTLRQASVGASESASGPPGPDIPSRHAVLPWHRFYWGVLDVSGLPERARRGMPARALLDERFQDEIPVAIEFLATAYVRASDATVLACGIESIEIEALRGSCPEAHTLTPAEVAPSLGPAVQGVRPGSLNVFVGPHEPPELTRVRLRIHRMTLAAAIVVFGVVALGLLKRAGGTERDSAAIALDTREALARAVGKAGESDVLVLTLEGERATLVRTRTRQAEIALPPDAADALCSVLRAWPESISVQTQSLSSTAQGITIAAVAGDRDGAERLTSALGAVPGWTLQAPRVSATRSSVRVDASLSPKGAIP